MYTQYLQLMYPKPVGQGTFLGGISLVVIQYVVRVHIICILTAVCGQCACWFVRACMFMDIVQACENASVCAVSVLTSILYTYTVCECTVLYITKCVATQCPCRPKWAALYTICHKSL